MKSLGITQALAMRNLKDHGIVPPSDILFLGEASEEGQQEWGSRWLLEHRPDWFKGVAVVLNEGGINEMILRTVRFWGIETVQAGYGMIEFAAASPEPLTELAKRWPKLRSAPVEPLADVVEGFGMLANHLGHPLTDPLRHLQRVMHDPAELARLPDRYGAFLESRIFWTPQYHDQPGAGASSIVFTYISTPPGISPDPYLAPIEEDARRAGIKILESFSTGPTAASPYRDASGQIVPFVRLIQRVTEARYPGIPFGPIPGFAGVTTSVLFRNRGIAAYGYSPVPFNITDAARRHGNDERIYLRDYVDGLDLYKELLLEFALSGDKTSPVRPTN
jgi:acetylornithine deacetylase/succinyl-diaminopimelate desuccinylase-like protein